MEIKNYLQKLKGILGLSLSLAKVNFKLRNEGSYLGIFWYLLDPFLMFLIILILGKVITRTEIENYPVYVLLGLIMFNFFRQATINAATSITFNAGFIKSMKISSESFVLSSVLQSVFSHFFEAIILLVFIIYFKISLLGIIFYPFIFFLLLLFVIGASFLLATLGVYINDLTNVWSVVINLLWFATPIFYIISAENLTVINRINPMFYFVNAARDLMLYNRIPSMDLILKVVLLSALFLLLGVFVFEKYKRKFAELI